MPKKLHKTRRLHEKSLLFFQRIPQSSCFIIKNSQSSYTSESPPQGASLASTNKGEKSFRWDANEAKLKLFYDLIIPVSRLASYDGSRTRRVFVTCSSATPHTHSDFEVLVHFAMFLTKCLRWVAQTPCEFLEISINMVLAETKSAAVVLKHSFVAEKEVAERKFFFN